MPTGQTLANNIMSHLGLNPPDGSAGASDSTTVMNVLNVMWNAWSVDEGLIWGQETYQAALNAGQGVYSIGSGGDLATTRPARIYKAFAVGTVAFTATTTSGSKTLTSVTSTANLALGQQVIGAGIPANTFINSIVTNTSVGMSNAATASATLTGTIYATTGNRNEIKIVEAGRYYDHNDLGATAKTPDEIYPDYLSSGSTGTMNLYLFPVPSAAPLALELDMAVNFSTWTLSGTYNIPPGVQDAIEWATAFRLLSTFGVAVMPQVAQVVTAEGQKAEARLRATNSFNRQLPPQMVAAPGSQQPAQGA